MVDDDDRRLDAVSGVFILARDLRRHISDLMAGEEWAADAGFRPPCLGVIAIVRAMQPVSQREISEQMGIDASDIVGVLDILERAHLVERRRDPADRRRHAVVLTEAGEHAARRFDALRAKAAERALGALSEDDRTALADLLNRALATKPSPAPSPASTA